MTIRSLTLKTSFKLLLMGLIAFIALLFALSFVHSPLRMVYCQGGYVVVDREKRDGSFANIVDSTGQPLRCPR